MSPSVAEAMRPFLERPRLLIIATAAIIDKVTQVGSDHMNNDYYEQGESRDFLSVAERSHRMSLIKNSDTKPEMVVRRLIHGMGYRYRLHDKKLPGKPDLVFRSREKVIFVNVNCGISKRLQEESGSFFNE